MGKGSKVQAVWLVCGLFASVAALAPGVAAAQPAAPPDAAVFFAPPDISRATLSPSGQRVALVGRDKKLQRDVLYVLPAEGAQRAEAVAAVDGLDVGAVRWVGNEWLVFDVADKSAGGSAAYRRGLFSVRFDGGPVKQLVRTQGTADTTSSRLSDRTLHAGHSLLHVPQASTDTVIVGEWRYDAGGDLQEVLPKQLNVATGLSESLAFEAPAGARTWYFNAQGLPKLVESVVGGRSRVHWRSAAGMPWALLADHPLAYRPWYSVGLDSESHILVAEASGPAGTRVLKRFDVTKREPAAQPFVSAAGFDFWGSVVRETDGGPVLGVHVVSDAASTVWLNPLLRQAQEAVDKLLPGRVNRLRCSPCTGDGLRVLVVSWSDRTPDAYYVFSPHSGRLQGLGASMPGVETARMGTLDLHRIKARDGRDLPLWVTLPPGVDKPGKLPAVLLVPSDATARAVSWEWQAMAQFLATRGYVVLQPEARGVTGYGEDHHRAGWKQWGRARQDDLADAVQWAVAQGWVDPTRVCAVGSRYGGYASLMMPVRHPGSVRCVAAWAAYAEPRLLLQRREDGSVYEVARRHYLPQALGDLNADAAMLAEISAVEQAARITTPVFLAYGLEDRVAPLAAGQALAAALRKAGREPQWLTYDDENHQWAKPETQVDFARRLQRYLAEHLGPRPPAR